MHVNTRCKQGPSYISQMPRTVTISNDFSKYFPDFCVLGNDEPDVKCLESAGLSAVPIDAPTDARNHAKYICRNAAGHGAVREFAEHIIKLIKDAKFQSGAE